MLLGNRKFSFVLLKRFEGHDDKSKYLQLHHIIIC